MEIVLRTETPEGIAVVLLATVYAKFVEEHPAVADLELIDRTVRHPDTAARSAAWPRALLPPGTWRLGARGDRIRRDTCDHRDRVPSRPAFGLRMASATVHVHAADLQLDGSYESASDVLYLSAPGDDKHAQAQETPEGHAARLDGQGRVTHLTAVNAKWLLDRDGELIATLRDGRQLRFGPEDVAGIVD